MLTLNELKILLILNDRLTQEAMLDLTVAGYKRLHELNLHRAVIKNCIIELLENSPALRRAA